MRKLHNLLYLTAIVLTVGLFATCSLEAPSVGHLAITIPYEMSSAEAVDSTARTITFTEGSAPAVRLYVLLNGKLLNLSDDDTYYKQVELNTHTVSLDLDPSSGYQVYAALGTTDNEKWTPEYYGSTAESFTVSAGVYTEKTITVIPVNFDYTSANAVHVAILDGTLWYTNGSKITDGTKTISTDTTINSLSSGTWFSAGDTGFTDELWINTDKGIYALQNDNIIPRFPGINSKFASAITTNIDGDAGSLLILYYGSDVGYAYSNDRSKDSVDSAWDSDSLSNFLDSEDGKDYKDLITDPGSFIKDAVFVINGDDTYGLVASTLGTYLYNSTMQNKLMDNTEVWIKEQLQGDSAYAMVVYDNNGKSAQISSLALDSTTNPSWVYAGTNSGLYRAATNDLSSAKEAPSLDLIPSTSGKKIKELAAYNYNGTSYAAYADSTGIVILKEEGESITSTYSTYPFYAFTADPGNITDLTFYESPDDGLYLAIACEDGLTRIPLSTKLKS